MRILRHYENVPPGERGGVVTLGNFDGFHRGHQQVLGRAAAVAAAEKAPLQVLTTEPHPRNFFNPDAPPFRLTPFRSKAHYFENFGIETLYVLTFDGALAGMEARDFVDRVLRCNLAVRHVVVGHDYRFGKGRGGDVDLLASLGESGGFGVSVVEPVGADGQIFSSTLIRRHLREGRPEQAADLLGHWWTIEGRVAEGEARGRTLGFPTANLGLDEYLVPAHGVYAVRVEIEEAPRSGGYGGVANLGLRPTFSGREVILEVHLFDFDQDIYGCHMTVELNAFLRPERAFDGIDALKAQIMEDCARARTLVADPNGIAGRYPPITREAFQP